MPLSRKDLAKINYLNSLEGQALAASVQKHGIPLDQVSDEVLPDDFEFDGWRLVGSVFCKTAGEYKAELAKRETSWDYW